ncbi:MAG: hypothetical protein KAI24_20750, partial [Planctomycetes bacterium]|nr:hypothetical protein [Planctomycetota bacterium]
VTAGQRVVLSGIAIDGLLGPSRLVAHDNAGTVLLDEVGSVASLGCELHVDDCDDLRARACRFAPLASGSSNHIFSSEVQLTLGTFSTAPLSAATTVTDSRLTLCDVTSTGGVFGGAFLLQNSQVRVLGTTTIQTFSAPAFGGAGAVRTDPAAAYLTGASPAFGPGVTVQVREMPRVVAGTAAAGGQANGTMRGPAAAYGWLFAGLSGPATALPGLDPVLLLAGSELLLASGPLVAPLATSYPVPNVPAVLGVAVTWQGVSHDPVYGLQLSNGTSYAHY